MAYSLGAVKPWVAAAANEVGPKFGIKTVYGWAPGLYDHPKGLALDFMINNIPNGKATGDALSAYVIANGARLGITYVIWYRRIWENGAWKDYHGTSNPHTDHVHVSFKASAPSGGGAVIDPGIIGTGFENVANPIDAFTSFANAFADTAKWLTDSHNWLRILYVFVGASLIIGILIVVLFKSDVGKKATGLVGDVVTG